MPIIKKIEFLVLALFLVGCKSVDVETRYNFDQAEDFSQFKTYRWVPQPDAAKLDDQRDKQIKDAVDAELARKGLSKTDADSADLYIGYQAAINTETQFTSYKTDWGYSPSWSGARSGNVAGVTMAQVSTISVGQLVLDMYVSKKHSLAWRGVADKTIDPKASSDTQQKNLRKAIAKLLENYPPEKTK
ncbi:MAG TPA: DUF4136 domain-containing protein [Terriglobales bacterium]|jgi:hypothetical protein